jgi:hypothetical protein
MSANAIDDLAKKMKSDYQKRWRLNNKDRVKKHNSNYWRKRAEAELGRKKAK